VKNLDPDTLDAIVAALPDPVFVIDEHGLYVDVLGGHRNGEDMHALIGKSVREVLPREIAEGVMASIRAALSRGATEVAEYQLADGTDDGAWFEARITPLPALPGGPRRVAWLSSGLIAQAQAPAHAEAEAEHDIIGLDPLTEAFSPIYFERLLEQEITRQTRYKEPFCLLLLDLDHFQAVRDTFGPAAGDHCLQMTARLMRHELRHSDQLARIGGEEFAVLLVNTSMNWGLEVGERIRSRIARTPIALPGRTLHLTVSGGVTDFRSNDTPDTLFRRADKGLGKSKDAGRDRISVA
jgi:diguanylate cyclase (GGDEF)-like protein